MLPQIFCPPQLVPWFSHTRTQSADGTYSHRLLVENPDNRQDITEDLQGFVQQVHEDGRRHLRNLVPGTLDPFTQQVHIDPAQGYPERLHPETLKAYFGELMAGIIVEVLSPFDRAWCVPAYPLVLHDLAFDRLEECSQTGGDARKVPGQGGNDCLAFQTTTGGQITAILICEAKCTKNHDLRLVDAAHRDIATTTIRSLRKLVEILAHRNDAASAVWQRAIAQLWLQRPFPDNLQLFNLVSYTCGRAPRESLTWISTTSPHSTYASDRALECVEVHAEVVDIVSLAYGLGEAND